LVWGWVAGKIVFSWRGKGWHGKTNGEEPCVCAMRLYADHILFKRHLQRENIPFSGDPYPFLKAFLKRKYSDGRPEGAFILFV